jgi:hypothetical protein
MMWRSIGILIGTSLFLPVFSTLAEGIPPTRYSSDLPGLGEPLQLAQADSAPAGEQGALSEQCREFARDIDADLGEVLKAGCEPTLAQMSALMDNPLGNVAMFFNQFDYYRMENSTFNENEVQGVYTAILQFPKRLNDDWNLINRAIFTVPSVPLDQDKIDDFNVPEPSVPPGGGPIQEPRGPRAPVDIFSGRTTGLGDSYYVGLFSPSEGIDAGAGKFLWGAGFDLAVPTATEDVLGSGKWSAGPSALGVYMGPKWKIGALGMHYRDFAGDGDREDVNLTNLQYFVYYSLDETTSIGAAPNIIANWEQDSDNRFTVPVGLGINKTFQFGKVPVRIGFEVHYSAIKPDDIVRSEWDFRLFIIPAAPSALFEWMQ